MNKLPLHGVRVIDITVVWALPWTGAMLGENGAEVIRVESLQHYPRLTRGILPRPPKELMDALGTLGSAFPNLDPGERPWDRIALFNGLHRSKLSCTMDLKREKGIEMFHKLVEKSDVIIENNSPDVMDKLGLTWENLREINPKLVYVRAGGYGQTGPYRNYSGLGMIFESMAGHSYLRWYDNDDMSAISPCFVSDGTAAAAAVFATMLGLRHRDKTGKGQMIDVSQIECFLGHTHWYFMDYIMNKRIHGAIGNRHKWAIQGCYMCKGAKLSPDILRTEGDDHWVVITINNDKEWEGFCRALGNPAWTKDEKFSDHLNRMKNHDQLDRHIEEWTSKRDKYKVMNILQKEGVPAGAILNSRDVFKDSHLKERGWAVPLTHPETGKHMYCGPVWKTDKLKAQVSPAPCLGEHNEYVYKEIIGVSDEEYEELVKEEHIGDAYIGV